MEEKIPLLDQNIKNYSECGICLEQVRKPKLLRCFHTFCLECLQTHIEGADEATLKCPLCQENTILPENGVAGLRDNVYIASIPAGTESGPVVCFGCDENKASKMCVECDEQYCDSCSKVHLKMKATREHHMVPQSGQMSKVSSRLFCGKHVEDELAFYCVDCEEVICMKCNMTKHKSHTCEDVADVASSKREEIYSYLKVKSSSYFLNTQLQDLQRQKDMLSDNANEVCREIREHTDGLKQNLEEIACAMIGETTKQNEIKIKELNKQISETENGIKSLNLRSNTVNQFLGTSGDSEFLLRFKELRDILHSFRPNDKAPTPPICTTFRYVPQSTGKDQLQKMCGNVEEKTEVTVPEFDVGTIISVPSESGMIEDMCSVSATRTSNMDGTGKDQQQQMFGNVEQKMDVTIPEFDVGTIITLPRGPGIVEDVCCVSATRAWIVDGKHAFLCTKDGKLESTINLPGVKGVALDSSETVYFACKSGIVRLGDNGETSTCFELPQQPGGLAINGKDELIVTFRSDEIVYYDVNGTQLRNIKLGQEAYKVAVDLVNGDIAATSYARETDLNMYDSSGKLITSVSGKDMDLLGICYLSESVTLAVDRLCGCIRLFSSGTLIHTIKPGRLEWPWSIDVDECGDMWIGCNSNQVVICCRKRS